MQPPSPTAPAPAPEPEKPSGWADINAVRAEWPQARLDAEEDLRLWHEGVRLYDNDDYQSMMRCATMLSAALAHSLYGEGILRGADLPETVHKVFYSSLTAPPDGRTFAESAQRAVRLALTVTRENGWHPASMGGQGLFDELIMDKGNYMLLTVAVGPAERLWEGSLVDFFAVPPQPAVSRIPDSRLEVVDQTQALIQRANAGDEVSKLRARGLGAWMNGDQAGGLELLEQAARLGDAEAMKDAGDLCSEMGKESEACSWFEAAAQAGNPQAMFNMGASAIRVGNRSDATTWFQRAAEAGDAEGYAALTQLADDANDAPAERHWARLGADEGQLFCMVRHGLHLTLDAGNDTSMLRRAVVFLETAAERGDVDAMLMAGNVNSQLGDAQRAASWFDRARATGDPKALRMLEKHGL
jgi:hypothetical protein